MKARPSPERFKSPELQRAYVLGFLQEYHHDSLRFEWMLEEAGSTAAGAERMAAMLEGAADALHALAAQPPQAQAELATPHREAG